MSDAVKVEYAVHHPTGEVDDRISATAFGPTTDLRFAQYCLQGAELYCPCTPAGSKAGPHTLATRTVTVSEWLTGGSEPSSRSPMQQSDPFEEAPDDQP